MVFNSTVHVKSDLLKKTKLSQKPDSPPLEGGGSRKKREKLRVLHDW